MTKCRFGLAFLVHDLKSHRHMADFTLRQWSVNSVVPITLKIDQERMQSRCVV